MFFSQKAVDVFEDTIDTDREVIPRHQELYQRVSQLDLVPSAANGPPSQIISQYTPTTFHGARSLSGDQTEDFPDEQLIQTPHVEPLSAVIAGIHDPATGSPIVNRGESITETVATCKIIAGQDLFDQKIRISFMSIQGSHGSLVRGFNGLGGNWMIQGILAVNNMNAIREFGIAQVVVSLNIICGGEADFMSYKDVLLAPKDIVLSNESAVAAKGTVYFPFCFTLGKSYPPALNAQYIKTKPYVRYNLTGTVKYIGWDMYHDYDRNIYLNARVILQQFQLSYDIPTPHFHRPSILSLMSPPQWKTITKNSQTKKWTARWSVNVERNVIGKGDTFKMNAIFHSFQTSEPVRQFAVQLLEIIGYKKSKKSTPVLKQVCCHVTRTALSQELAADVPYTFQISIPKEVLQGNEPAASTTDKINIMNSCNPDGEWCGYIVTHAIRVLVEAYSGKSKKYSAAKNRVLDFLEIPVVILGFNRAMCQGLTNAPTTDSLPYHISTGIDSINLNEPHDEIGPPAYTLTASHD